MFGEKIVTGPLLMGIFILAIVVLLVLIIKFKLNAFVALLVTAFATGILVNMPLNDVAQTVTDGFGGTLGSIGMVTGLGVMLGKFMFESGGIESICNRILKVFGDKKSPIAVALSGFITGIPVFGDVVYIMFAPMLRVLSKKTKISMVTYACAISVATTCTFALVLPTAPPLAVAETVGIDIGIFFFYALISAFVGMFAGGIIWGKILDKQDQKKGHFYTFDDLEEEEAQIEKKSDKELMGAGKALSILLVPIILILLGSFVPLAVGSDAAIMPVVTFIGNKNFAMMCGVIYAALISRKYIEKTATDVMTEAADQVGLILLITGAGGAFGKILQATGIADYVAGSLSQFSIPILVLCFLIAQIIRCAQGSTTVALMTTAAILANTIAASGVSPILCSIAICAGGIGLSLPNDSGFWAISRFFRISVTDTIRGWTIGGFIAGVAILIFVSVLSLFQGVLPGLV
ncbi:GntP family gluconate:H+ symporter [Aequitasia blattaphilus]|uniref:GntP family permease n=1 Tax=Aequitasia blattaphilus TaxID=2949332 RepID=A0ABT1E5E9_9FIRM|nr:GntP family permease [Aequitasia blattaphilus]MCP1100931.1 GntP family permease [Aequitasia blattaphilus]MCR8613571.1 GntP family permease [Aequitasia blattaphilus]